MKQARLNDGRVLAFAEWGEPQGRPVLFFHGTPGGRLTQWWDDRLPGDKGVRLVTVDRPGIGGSDPARGRSVADWAQDIGQLADHLGLDRLAVVGFSSGGADCSCSGGSSVCCDILPSLLPCSDAP